MSIIGADGLGSEGKLEDGDLRFVKLPGAERAAARDLPPIAAGDRIVMNVIHRDGSLESMTLPPTAATLVRDALDRLSRGRSVTILDRRSELGIDEAASVLDLPRSILMLRVEGGDLAARRTNGEMIFTLEDVLIFKDQLERQRAAQRELADITKN